jgi:hypothetical protein
MVGIPFEQAHNDWLHVNQITAGGILEGMGHATTIGSCKKVVYRHCLECHTPAMPNKQFGCHFKGSMQISFPLQNAHNN